jgi:hypothetical protein
MPKLRHDNQYVGLIGKMQGNTEIGTGSVRIGPVLTKYAFGVKYKLNKYPELMLHSLREKKDRVLKVTPTLDPISINASGSKASSRVRMQWQVYCSGTYAAGIGLSPPRPHGFE